MGKKRVYEFAKELNVTSKEVLAVAKDPVSYTHLTLPTTSRV